MILSFKKIFAVVLTFIMIFSLGLTQKSEAGPINVYYTFQFSGGPYDGLGVYRQFKSSDMDVYNKIYRVTSNTTLFKNNWTKRGSRYTATKNGTLKKNTYVVIGKTKKMNGINYTQVQVVRKNTYSTNSVYTISKTDTKSKSKCGWVQTSKLKRYGSQYIIGQAWYGTKYSTRNKSLYNDVVRCSTRLKNVSTKLNKKYFYNIFVIKAS